MLIAYDDRLTNHLEGVAHPEQPDRVRVVAGELERRGMLNDRIDTQATQLCAWGWRSTGPEYSLQAGETP